MQRTSAHHRENHALKPAHPRRDWVERREFLAGAGALAMQALLSSRGLAGHGTTVKPWRVDMHHHFGPPTWCSYLASKNVLYPAWKDWTREKSVQELDRAGVVTAMVSITYPGIWLGENVAPKEATSKLARECNDYGARMVADYPGRFGLFAVLPLPDIDRSLREIEYVFDTLKADGVGLLTSYGDKWLGDAVFSPVFEELNRRKAVVFTHANVPSCCTRGGSGAQRYLVPGVNNNVIEYGTDTTRAIMSLVVINVSEKYPNLHFTFSHGGGTMPYLIERILGRKEMASLTDPSLPNARLHQLRQFYYDTANANNVVAMTALSKVVGVSQILFGTDFPYEGPVEEQLSDLTGCGAFKPEELRAICYGNAVRLTPRLKV
ncbi:MAG: amidohydrolase [Acidobacteriota bacterium]|nr:amidohydrolase [Acidobacteriota bacterium]